MEISQNSQYLKDADIQKDLEKMKIAIYMQILTRFYKRRDKEIAHILPGTNEEIMELYNKSFCNQTKR